MNPRSSIQPAAALLALVLLQGAALRLSGQKPENVLVVVNSNSSLSAQVGEYYSRRRGIPKKNVCVIRTRSDESVTREEYDREIAGPVGVCLRSRGLAESVLYIATTAGVPLRVGGRLARDGDNASVDSELTLLYGILRGERPELKGPIPNPFFRKLDAHFRHPDFPIYLVTRLAGYDFNSVKGMIDRALVARNTGKFVIDCKSASDESGDRWLKDAAILLPSDRVVLDESATVLRGQKSVIGFASWGSNDPNRKQRLLGFEWLPGAIMTEFVSTNARTFKRPPATWNISTWKTPELWFAGSPQTMIADYIEEGATGAAGHIDEPYLGYTPRPDFLLPAWYSGRTLAESYYLSIPALSWQNVVLGDPLCTLGPPR